MQHSTRERDNNRGYHDSALIPNPYWSSQCGALSVIAASNLTNEAQVLQDRRSAGPYRIVASNLVVAVHSKFSAISVSNPLNAAQQYSQERQSAGAHLPGVRGPQGAGGMGA